MKHKWMRLFVDGKWTGRDDRIVTLSDGTEHNIDDLAKEHGIELPDAKKSKKQINTDIEEEHGDLESSQHSGDPEEHGDRDSESTE